MGYVRAVQIVMSVLVLVSGLYVALIGNATDSTRLLGWLLVLVGAGGLLVALWTRRRTRG